MRYTFKLREHPPIPCYTVDRSREQGNYQIAEKTIKAKTLKEAIKWYCTRKDSPFPTSLSLTVDVKTEDGETRAVDIEFEATGDYTEWE